MGEIGLEGGAVCWSSSPVVTFVREGRWWWFGLVLWPAGVCTPRRCVLSLLVLTAIAFKVTCVLRLASLLEVSFRITSYLGNMASKVTTDMVKPFDGSGDVVAWLTKVKLVAKLQKVSDVACFLPLFLEGDALAMYLELSEDNRKNIDDIEAKLMEAFSDGQFVAHAKLIRMRWTGEAVDVYANEIRRLASLSKFTGAGLEQVVKLTFVNGFPDNISASLQQMSNIDTATMSDIIARARMLTARMGGSAEVCSVSVAHRREGVDSVQIRRANPQPKRTFGPCYRCGGPHIMRFCKESKPQVICFKCKESGHIASNCSQSAENY